MKKRKRPRCGVDGTVSILDADLNPFEQDDFAVLPLRAQSLVCSASSTQGANPVAPLPKASTQMFLDFGQSEFTKTCGMCGMVYSPGVDEDEILHKRTCKKQQHLRPEAQEFFRLPHHGAIHNKKQYDVLFEYEPRNMPLFKSDEKKQRENANLDRWIRPSAASRANSAKSEDATSNVVEREFVAKIKPGSPLKSSIVQWDENILVDRIWVHAGARRTGIATKLLDVCRAHVSGLVVGSVLPKRKVWWSSLSQDGIRFAKAYCETDSLNTFEFHG
eukprot:ANDGO_02008.mRNA.1 hypothetical protein